jgi:DNA-binding NtrC family response regulator
MKTVKTILVVDEDAEVRDCLQRVLESTGYHVLLGGGGGHPMDHVDPALIDLMLLDVSFLVRHGWDSYIRFSVGRPGLPIILLNGHTGHAGYPIPSNVRLHLDKPFDAPHLLEAIRRVLQNDDPEGQGDGNQALDRPGNPPKSLQFETPPRWKPRFRKRWIWTSCL